MPTYLADTRKKFVNRLKKLASDSCSRLEEVTAFALLPSNTPAEIFILNNKSQAQRLAVPVGEAAMITLDTVTQKVSDGSVTGEKVTYLLKNVAGTITLTVIGSVATIVVPTGNASNQLVLTATAPTNAAYQVVCHLRRVSALR